MKKIILLFLLTALGISETYGQNVGIGTATPASKLSVSGNLSVGAGYVGTAAPTDGAIIEGWVGIGTTTPDEQLVIGANHDIVFHNGGNEAIGFSTDYVSGSGWVKDPVANYHARFEFSPTTGAFVLVATANSPATSADTRFFVSSVTGNVGIGTASPGASVAMTRGLEINGTNSTQFVISRNNTPSFAVNVSAGVSGDVHFYDRVGGTWNNFLTGRGGNVGIGVNPTTKLDINGNLRIRSVPATTSGSMQTLVVDAGGYVYKTNNSSRVHAGNVTGYQISGLIPGKRYLIGVYGITANKGTGTATLGGVRILNTLGNVIAQTPAVGINWPDGNVPQSASIVITTPSNGIIRCYVDNNIQARFVSYILLD